MWRRNLDPTSINYKCEGEIWTRLNVKRRINLVMPSINYTCEWEIRTWLQIHNVNEKYAPDFHQLHMWRIPNFNYTCEGKIWTILPSITHVNEISGPDEKIILHLTFINYTCEEELHMWMITLKRLPSVTHMKEIYVKRRNLVLPSINYACGGEICTWFSSIAHVKEKSGLDFHQLHNWRRYLDVMKGGICTWLL